MYALLSVCFLKVRNVDKVLYDLRFSVISIYKVLGTTTKNSLLFQLDSYCCGVVIYFGTLICLHVI